MASNPFRNLTPTEITALCIYGEARGESLSGKAAVGSVIRNRVDARRLSYHDVILQPAQFSCFSPSGGAENYRTVKALAENPRSDDPVWNACLWVATGIITRACPDETLGADHYLTTALYKSAKRPSWATVMRVTTVIGSHTFLKS